MRKLALLVLVLAAAPVGAQSGKAQFEVTEASITDLQKAMTEGTVTSVQITQSYLARIAAYDHAGPEINAMIRLNPHAKADAAAMDAERKAGLVRGPLHGVPIILKDNYDTKDMITSAGSIALATHQPRTDAFVVQKLRDAGAIILGKANMHELAAGITSVSSYGGQTKNPYDLSRCPGGSSGGTGAAIAASFAAIGWGSDTCGSIRIPSAFGSLFGLRPSVGLFSRDGIVPLSHTQDTPGPLARTVRDLAIGLDATVGADSHDASTRVSEGIAPMRFVDSLRTDAFKGTRIGIFTPYFRDADADVADSVRSAARSLQTLGAEVVNVSMPDFDAVIAGTRAINFDTKYDLIEYFARPGGAPVTSLHEILEKGLYDRALEARFKDADTVSAPDSPARQLMLTRQAQLRVRITALMDSLHLDALAYPTSVRKPVLQGDPQLGTTCALASQTGLPAISMPAGFTSDGLPTGMELLGRAFSDARLVSFAYAYEQRGTRRRPPPSTPVLVNGAAPSPMRFTASAGRSASGSFAFNPLTSELSYDIRVAAAAQPSTQAVVFRRADAAGTRVIKRVSGPGMPGGAGRVRLLGADLDAFRDGRVTMAVFGSTSATPASEVPLRRAR